jgi:hypothetical protein
VVRKTEFIRTELYADWFAPQRFHSVMAAPTLFENDATAVLVAFRDQARGDFDAADLDQAKRFAGHFGSARAASFGPRNRVTDRGSFSCTRARGGSTRSRAISWLSG